MRPDIAKKVVDGAHVIDINVDDGMLDGLAAMQKFVKIAATEPEVSKAPFMLIPPSSISCWQD